MGRGLLLPLRDWGVRPVVDEFTICWGNPAYIYWPLPKSYYYYANWFGDLGLLRLPIDWPLEPGFCAIISGI